MIFTASHLTVAVTLVSSLASTVYAIPIFPDDLIDIRTSEDQPHTPPSIAQALLRVAKSADMPYYPSIFSAVIKGANTESHLTSREDLDVDHWVRSVLQENLESRELDEVGLLEARVPGAEGQIFQPSKLRKGLAAAARQGLKPKDPELVKAATTPFNPEIASKVLGSSHIKRALEDFLEVIQARAPGAGGKIPSSSRPRPGTYVNRPGTSKREMEEVLES